ncbi:DNA-binding transcriptional regulator, LysR family [Paenibacillus sp. cl141a]|uniref:LysR family transcriptional regulator n=1 Tax=Paenibacillus sp. cl141a TaxID=1761877 RepID=UPI0008C29291|nr:LysR family transcriptional regulator [Paenibacillus sp. cl141a]SEL57351.1 DNA-binding transcriptional regulator, LysR family [Paenibacillus sp. cl141a]
MIANTEWYRVFLHAAETSNLTKAAQNLHMTQPSVSYAIKQLEEALGVGLFDRLSKGVRLTQEGQALYQHVRQAFDELGSAERRLKKLKQFGEGRLRIGANGAIVKDFLLSLLDRFHARYPDIRIQLSQERTSSIVERLKKGSLDLGFVHLPVSDEEIHIIDSRTSPYCAVVGTAFADWARRPLRTEELTELPLLLLSPGSSTRSFIEGWFRSQGVEVEADFELNSLDMLAEFAERGYGTAFLPRAFVSPRISDGSLLELRTDTPLPDRYIGVAVRKHQSPSLAAGAFLEMLQQN